MSYIGNRPFPSIVTSSTIQDGEVRTEDIANDAVTEAKVADGAISSDKIASGAVTSDKLAAGAAVPDQTGHAGQFLTTDGTNADWATVDTDANTTTKALYEHDAVFTANYTIADGNNAMSAGPITVDPGVIVTVPTGSRWAIV